MSITLTFDATNPGQYFACCGIFELADRLWGDTESWFSPGKFHLRGQRSTDLATLLNAIVSCPLEQLDSDDETASPVRMGAPFHLRLDWWKDHRARGVDLKVWAGRMSAPRIASAMQQTLQRPELQTEDLFDHAMVVYDPAEPAKKVEPFYFDCRRGANAHPLDIGFSPDALQMTTNAYPAVEFLCLIGLQRFRPAPCGNRVFQYHLWSNPLPLPVAAAAACGRFGKGDECRFENVFRTDQRKHKAFAPAVIYSGRRDDDKTRNV